MAHDRMPTEYRRDWAWATEHAAPEWASTVQLVSWLARGELPPHTLVWKPGWGEWLPALQVAELADAFPGVTAGSRRVARVAFDGAAAPPPVPVAQYPRLRLLVKDVIRESSGPYPPIIPARLAQREPVLVRYRDADHAQQELVTTQMPAADMLEAAQAMQALDMAAATGEQQRKDARHRTRTTLPPATLPPPSLAPLALELDLPRSERLRSNPAPRSRGYGRWLSFGALAGAVLGVVSAGGLSSLAALAPLQRLLPAALVSAPPPATVVAALDARTVQESLAPQPPAPPRAVERQIEQPVVAPAPVPVVPSAPRPPRIRVKRSGEPAVLQALRVTKNNGFDRLVFEFRERVPGYRIEYVDKAVRDCDSGQARRVEGAGRLELQFFPAQARDELGQPTFRPRELRPGLSIVREIERACDRNGVLTWVVGAASANRYRAYEMSAPPRLVVQIEH